MKFKFPGVKIIDRYVMRKFLGTYLFAIGLIIIIVVIFDYAEKIDDFTELNAPFSSIVFQYYLNFIPFFANQFSGLFTFIAVIFFTSKMAYNTEIIAILSGGVSFKRFMWPYFLSALLITMLSLLLNLIVIPAANTNRIKFESKYIKSRLSASGQFDQNIYRQIVPGTFVYIRGFKGDKNTADYIALETFDNTTLVSSLEAANPSYDPATSKWTAPQSIRRTFEDGREHFDNTLSLDTVINITPDELGSVEDLVKTMNIVQLNRFIKQQKIKGSDMISTFEVERQNRFSLPLSTFILTIIGVSLSSRKVRGGTGLHIGIGIGLCFSFILLSKFFDEFAKNGVMPAAIGVWMPSIIYSFIAVYLYKKAPK